MTYRAVSVARCLLFDPDSLCHMTYSAMHAVPCALSCAMFVCLSFVSSSIICLSHYTYTYVFNI